MMNMRLVLIFALAVCPLASLSSPLKREEDTGEMCRGDYCAMFEGICKNGGTCVSKGCKGECKCTKDFTGHNCEMPKTPVTTKAPTLKEEKSKEKDFSTILSLFRMLSIPRSRPSIPNQFDKKEDTAKKERVTTTVKAKESEKDSVSNNKRRDENYPKRQETVNERKKDDVSSKIETKEKKRSKETAEVKISEIEATTSGSSSGNNVQQSSTRINMPYIQTTIPQVSKFATTSQGGNTQIFSNTTPRQEKASHQLSPKIQAPRTMKLISENGKIGNSVQNIKSITRKPIIADKTTKQTTSTQQFNIAQHRDTVVFSGKTGHLVPKVFHASALVEQGSASKIKAVRDKLEVTTISTTLAGNQIQDKVDTFSDNKNTEQTTLDIANALAKITSAGQKVLSSTTLSNLYLTHTLLSKSRIFVSTIPNESGKGNKVVSFPEPRSVAVVESVDRTNNQSKQKIEESVNNTIKNDTPVVETKSIPIMPDNVILATTPLSLTEADILSQTDRGTNTTLSDSASPEPIMSQGNTMSTKPTDISNFSTGKPSDVDVVSTAPTRTREKSTTSYLEESVSNKPTEISSPINNKQSRTNISIKS